MRTVRAAWRVACGLYWVLVGMLTVALVFPAIPPVRRMRIVRWWARHMLTALAVRLHVHGHVPDEGHPGLLLVANHVSWLDILAIDATLPSHFVSKAEVRRWPVIGWLAAMAGTLFLERGKRRDAARIGEVMAGALNDGSVVAVFPEGTVGDGRRLLPFHANLLQPAVAASAQVLPVAIKYVDEWPASEGTRPHAVGDAAAAALLRGPSSATVAYDGDVTIGHSILRVLKARGLAVHLALCPLMDPGDDRKRLAKHARQAIAHVLEGPSPATG